MPEHLRVSSDKPSIRQKAVLQAPTLAGRNGEPGVVIDHHLLPVGMGKVGRVSSAGASNATPIRAMTSQPARPGYWLLQLQGQYGNRCVQSMLNLSRQVKSTDEHVTTPALPATVPLQRSIEPVIMRAAIFASTIQICRRLLRSRRVFHVSQGGLIVTSDAGWEASSEWRGAEPPSCGREIYNITLNKVGRLFDREWGTCEFEHGRPVSRSWTNLPEGDYYLTIWTNNTNPNCCLRGNIEVSQERGLSGDTCTRPPASALEILHSALDVAGLIPALGVVPDAINAGAYLIEGDWVNAGISAVAMVELFGQGATITRLGLRVTEEAVERTGREAIEVGLRQRWRGTRLAEATAERGFRGLARRIAGTQGLEHSFDRHAAQWFGRPVTRETHLAEWQALLERAAQSTQVVRWSTGQAETIGHLARIDNKYFFVQFFASGPRAGELATAFVPNQRQLTEILRLLR